MVLIVMGVTGSGKTTVGNLLAQKLRWQFADADDFHPASNIEKMRSGAPLDDPDRLPWLAALRKAIQNWNESGQNVVLACSALKRSYREKLRAGPVQFVYLKGSHELILGRLRSRHGHFASEAILNGQFADLEEPESEDASQMIQTSEPDDTITVEINKTPEAIASEIMEKLKLPESGVS
jgi:gluconokinase